MIEYQWRILEWMEKELKKIPWVSFGNCSRPKAESILILPLHLTQPAERGQQTTDHLADLRPGVVISPARTVSNGGSLNCEDDAEYPIVVQMFDRDMATRPQRDRVRTWLMWEQQVRHFFSQSDFRGEIDSVMWSAVPSSQWLSKNGFEASRDALWAVPVIVKNREPRDAKSRSGGINGE